MAKVIMLSGTVGWGITAQQLRREFPEDNGPVLLKVDSVGGSVFEGNRLFNVIKDYPGELKVELGAIAASISSYFPLGAGVENISVRENTTFMGHKAWTFATGNADDMKAKAEILDGFDTLIAKVYSRVTGKSVKDTLVDMGNEFWLIGGESIVAAGFASEVIPDSEGGEEEPAAVLENSEVLAMIENAKNELKGAEQSEDLNKWAAELKAELNPPEVDPDGQAHLFNNIESSPIASGGNKDFEEEFMGLNEFLEKNPEAKAEFDERITAAAAEGIEAAVKAERARGTEILQLAGATIPAPVMKAYSEGQTKAEYAVAEVERQNTASAAADEGTDLGALGAADQLPAEGGEENALTKGEKIMDEAVEKLLSKGKK